MYLPAKLIRTLLLSVVFVLLGNILADGFGIKYWLPGISGTSSRVYAYLHSEKPAEILVLGSSRSVQGVIPRVIEEEYGRLTGGSTTAYNLAMAGNGLSTAAILLEDATGAVGCPGVILLELSPRALDRDSKNIDRALEYHASLGDTIHSLPFIRRVDTFNAAGWGLLRGFLNMTLWVFQPPWTNQRQSFLDIWVSTGGSPHSYPDPGKPPRGVADWSSRERSRNLRRTPLGKRAADSPDIPYGGYPARALDATLELAQECGSRVIIWTSPTTRDYAALYRSAEVAQFEGVLRDLSSREQVEVFEVDGRFGFEDTEFEDFTHLNSHGAVKLSRALAGAIVR